MLALSSPIVVVAPRSRGEKKGKKLAGKRKTEMTRAVTSGSPWQPADRSLRLPPDTAKKGEKTQCRKKRAGPLIPPTETGTLVLPDAYFRSPAEHAEGKKKKKTCEKEGDAIARFFQCLLRFRSIDRKEGRKKRGKATQREGESMERRSKTTAVLHNSFIITRSADRRARREKEKGSFGTGEEKKWKSQESGRCRRDVPSRLRGVDKYSYLFFSDFEVLRTGGEKKKREDKDPSGKKRHRQ